MRAFLICVVAFSGCITRQAIVSNQASFDHQCPVERIKMISYSNDNRSIVLNVCGEIRRYRDVNGSISEGVSTWIDVTKLSEK
jgi:hypothetical protein